MNFGLFMMPLHPPHRSFADSYDRDIDLIVAADKLGYKEAWIGEHITERWENAPCPDLLIAKALALTEQIIFGTGVTLLAIHNPVELAHRLAMLDHLARGRFYWGHRVPRPVHGPADFRHRPQAERRGAGAGARGAGRGPQDVGERGEV